jgi:hypothetical protein
LLIHLVKYIGICYILTGSGPLIQIWPYSRWKKELVNKNDEDKNGVGFGQNKMSSSTKADIEDLRRIKPHEGKSSSEEPTNKQYLVDVSFVWLLTDRALRRVYNRLSGIASRSRIERELQVIKLSDAPFLVSNLGWIVDLCDLPQPRLRTPWELRSWRNSSPCFSNKSPKYPRLISQKCYER